MAGASNQVGNGSQRSRSLTFLTFWVGVFMLGVGVLSLRGIVFNLVFNHLLFVNWGFLGAVLTAGGIVGLSSFLPEAFNLWQHTKRWSQNHLLSSSLLLLGIVMLNPVFTALMVAMSYILESRFGGYLALIQQLCAVSIRYSIDFLSFLGGLRNPFDFVKGIWANLGKIASVTTAVLCAGLFCHSMAHVLNPAAYALINLSAAGMNGLAIVMETLFSGGAIPSAILTMLSTGLASSMVVLVPLTAVFVAGVASAWFWDNRVAIANSIDRKTTYWMNTYLDPILRKIADKTRGFRIKYLGDKILPEPVEGYSEGKITYEQALKIIEDRKARQQQGAAESAEENNTAEAAERAVSSRTYVASRPVRRVSAGRPADAAANDAAPDVGPDNNSQQQQGPRRSPRLNPQNR